MPIIHMKWHLKEVNTVGVCVYILWPTCYRKEEQQMIPESILGNNT